MSLAAQMLQKVSSLAGEQTSSPPIATPTTGSAPTSALTEPTSVSTGTGDNTSNSESESSEDDEEDGDGSASGTSGPKRKGPKKKRKRRPTGIFHCDFEGCDKSFTRQEHLARHKLNHNPTVIYECTWPGCEKSFVRGDLRERHVKRHETRKLKEEAKARNALLNGNKRRRTRAVRAAVEKNGATDSTTPMSNVSSIAPASASASAPTAPSPLTPSLPISRPSDPPRRTINSLDSIILPNIEDSAPINIHNYDNESHLSAASGEVDALRSQDLPSFGAMRARAANPTMISSHNHANMPFLTSPASPNISNIRSMVSNSSSQQHQHQHQNHNQHHQLPPPRMGSQSPQPSSPFPQNAPSPARLINWLFEDQIGSDLGNLDSVPHLNNGNFFNPDDDPFGLSSDLLNDILVIPPNFPHPAQQTTVTTELVQSLVRIIPSLASHEHLQHIDIFLEAFWTTFHTQYPILHKPSFSTTDCQPILLLAMIMTGAAYSTSNPKGNFDRSPREFGDLIAEPLRSIIFSAREFQPPSRVWVIQSLLLLEQYERLSTNRSLHERAYVHHGTAIQLLRRSPGLGGNPMNNKVDYDSKQDATIWEKWIEFETMKRAALFAFYIDSTHAIVFGYQLMLFTHQIQLSLPCDEELWESYLTPKEIPNKSEQLPFLVGLKKLLNREPVQTSRFGKKILLSGLLTIMLQMQQRDLQGSLLEFDEMRDTWKDSVSLALDYWSCDIMNGCCYTPNSIYWKAQDRRHGLPLALREDDTRCKFPVYHMAQITLRIQHYDYYIYAGAPWRMNVEAEASDYELVDRKIREWAGSMSGKISVAYAYMFLFEMFLSPQDSPTQYEYKFHSNEEAIYERLNVLALVTLLIWSYNYSTDGPESRVLLHNPMEMRLMPKESGQAYLRRIRDEFSRHAGEFVHTHQPGDSVKYHNMIRLMASKLPHIRNKHHITGMLKMISEVFLGNYWEVGDEFSRLIRNCYRRSFGSTKVRCDDMYKRKHL